MGGGPGWPGRGRKVAAARRGRGEGGADPDVHSWAPGEVEAPGPAAGGRATDAGTGTAAAAATMVKGPLPSRPHPGTPRGNSRPPLPPTLRPGEGGDPGWGRGGVRDPRQMPPHWFGGGGGKLGWPVTRPGLQVESRVFPLHVQASLEDPRLDLHSLEAGPGTLLAGLG